MQQHLGVLCLTVLLCGFCAAAGSSRPVPAENQIAVVAPITAEPCPLSYGETSLKQAFINKRDWAMLHNHEFHARPLKHDPSMPSTWYRLNILKQVRLHNLSPEHVT